MGPKGWSTGRAARLVALWAVAVGLGAPAAASAAGYVQQTLAFSGLTDPQFVAVDGAGDVYVTDTGHSRVVKLAPDGTQTTLPFAGLGAPEVSLWTPPAM
jgi:hypothetical protein